MNQKKTEVDRRRGPDFWVKFVQISRAVVWAIMLTIVILLDQAKPEMITFFDRIFHLDVRQNWDHSLMKIVFYLSLIQLALSSFSLAVNAKRHRRKSDRFSKSHITVIILTVLILLFTLKNI